MNKTIIGYTLIALGILIIVLALVCGIIGSWFMLALGIWNIAKTWGTITFGMFFVDIILIFGREFIVLIGCFFAFASGLFVITSGKQFLE